MDAGAERIPRAGGSPAEPARGWEECKVSFLAGKVQAGVRGGTGVKKQREEQRQGNRDVTLSKKRSGKGVKDRNRVPQRETDTETQNLTRDRKRQRETEVERQGHREKLIGTETKSEAKL